MLYAKCIYMYICTYGHTKDRAIPPISILYFFTLILYFDIFNYNKQHSFVSSSIFLRTLKYPCSLQPNYIQCIVQVKCGATTAINSFDDCFLNSFVFWYVQGYRVDFFVVTCKCKYFFHYFIVTVNPSQS